MSVRHQQIEAAARAMWERDFGEAACWPRNPDAIARFNPWERESEQVRTSYRDLALRALAAGAKVRQEHS